METVAPVSTSEVVEFLRCRACGKGNLELVFDLGVHAVSDFYSSIPENELKAPLAIMQCGDCGLAQLSHSVSRERLYKDYWYHSGTNESMVAALKDVVDDAMERRFLKEGDTVLDIGANDGTLLQAYPENIRRVAIDPSVNIFPWMHKDKRSGTLGDINVVGFYPQCRDYFLWDVDSFGIITSIAMFYDLDNPNEFVQAIAKDLAWDGIWINQMMDLEGMLIANAFDNICHEHVAYWRQGDFKRLIAKYGLGVTDTSYNMTNGGSTRFISQHSKRTPDTIESSMRQAFKNFVRRVQQTKEQCLFFLDVCHRGGKTVGGYGASTKGNTLLQYYGISSELLPWIADRNPEKVGKVTAGTHIPIISEEDMRDRKPDYLLVLPWAFLNNFLAREKTLREEGTRFIVPLPFFQIV